MGFKKLAVAAAITSALFISQLPVAANSATIKAGAACSKAGITKVVSNKKYTCVKSGKKTVWNSGTKVVAKPAASAPAITLDKLDPKWTPEVALRNVKTKLASMPLTTLAPEIIASPNVNPKEIELEKKHLVSVMQMFQDVFAPAKFQVVMFTNLDGAWADNALNTYGGSFPGKVSEEIAKQSEGNRRCNFAFATENRTTRVPVYYSCTDTRSLRAWPNYQNPPHEYFHLVHHAVAPVRTPVWLFEGSASYFGEVLGNLAENTLQRKLKQGFLVSRDFDPNNEGFDPGRFTKWLSTATADDVVKVFKALESEPSRPRSAYAHYAIGSWATEALVATYGVDGFMKLWKNLGSGMSFQSAFQESFGVSPDEFYAKLTPYLKSRVEPNIN